METTHSTQVAASIRQYRQADDTRKVKILTQHVEALQASKDQLAKDLQEYTDALLGLSKN